MKAKQSKDFSPVLPEKVREQTIPDRIKEGLASTGWDALAVVGPENAQYCSGAWVPYAKGYLDRQTMVIWSRQGEATVIGAAENLGGMKPWAFVSRFVGYEEEGALPPAVIVDTLAEELRSQGFAKGLIGLEMLRTPVPFFNRLVELLPEARFESADDMLRRLRMIKTMEEIETMSTGARLTDDGVWKGLHAAKAGDTELQVSHKIISSILENGCQFVPSLLLGVREGARALGGASDRELRPGDILRLDLNTLYGNLYCDMGRMAVVGEPNAEQTRAYRDQVELNMRIIEFMRPGRTCSEVHAFYVEQAERMNLERWIYPYIGIGHAIGVNNDEYPKLNAADQTVLEPGMILDLEPDTIGPEGEIFHYENMLLVTTEGVEVLTQSEGHDWSELPVIPA